METLRGVYPERLFLKGFFTTEHTENTEKTIKKSLWALWSPWSKLLIIAKNGLKKHSLSVPKGSG